MSSRPRTALGQFTLPAHYYLSAEIFDRETERIFWRRWIYAGRRGQAASPGDYFLTEIGRESIIILRDHEGVYRAFYNVCRHRGTRLCQAGQGRLAQTIQCPYHAWTYNLKGELTGAPNMKEVAGFEPGDYPLHGVSIAQWDGGLFINLDPACQPFNAAYQPLLDRFTRWEIGMLEAAHRLEYEVKANWKLILQNYSECYHCPSLHPQLNRLTPYRDSSNDLEEGPFLGGPMRLAHAGGSMTTDGNRCAPPLGSLDGDDLNRIYYYVLFPNMLLSLHPDYVLVHRLERIDAGRTRVVCDWLFHPSASSDPGFDPAPAIEFWNLTNLQDWHVCELSQLGVSSRAYRPGPYSELESMIAALDREYLLAMGDAAQ